jgi:hypothetical protein
VRLKIIEYISESATHFYYAHDSLDGAARCTPRYSDAEIYKVVKEITPPGHNGPLPTSLQFPDSVNLQLPFVTLVYIRAAYHFLSVVHGPNGDPSPPNPLFQTVLSLRHTFTMSADRTMLFVKRNYESRRPFLHTGKATCGNAFEFGWQEIKGVVGCYDVSCTGNPLREMEHCDTLVLNASGEGVCIQPSRLGAPRPAIYSVSAWRKIENGGKGISPKRLSPTCSGTARDCEVSLYLPP